MSETPAPEVDPTVPLVAGAELIVVGLVFTTVAILLVWALLRVSNKEPSTMVTFTLGLLTLVAVAASVITGSEALTTIAATGVGALAGAVSNLFDSGKRVRDQDEEERATKESSDAEQHSQRSSSSETPSSSSPEET